MSLGLIVAAGALLFVSWASWAAGFPVETAVLRGSVAFIALSFLAYIGGLIAISGPPAAAAANTNAENRQIAPSTPDTQPDTETQASPALLVVPGLGDTPSESGADVERRAA